MTDETKENIVSAVKDGISGYAVESTLEDVINKSEQIDSTPKQVKEVVETISDMKKDVDSEFNEIYASDLVKSNSDKIKRAIEEGIKPEEVAITLVNSTNEATNRKGKKHLKFVTSLISKLKRREFSLRRNQQEKNEKGKQKILE